MQLNDTLQQLLRDTEAAQILDISVATLRRWRHLHSYGPTYLKIGAAVRYRRGDIESFLASRAIPGEQIPDQQPDLVALGA